MSQKIDKKLACRLPGQEGVENHLFIQGERISSPHTIETEHAAYVRVLSGTVHVDPRRGTVYLPVPPPPIAAAEGAKIWGDPHIKEADGGKFDFQGTAGKTYNLFNDTGVVVNGSFQPWNGKRDKTVIGEIGAAVTGASGTSIIRINPWRGDRVTVNGRIVPPGSSETLADGGSLSFSQDGKKVIFRSSEGYLHTVEMKGSGREAHLDYSVDSPFHGVAQEGRLPGGLLGQTFDPDSSARKGPEGAPSDYEVPGGIFGIPKPEVRRPGAVPTLTATDPAEATILDVPIGTPFELVDPEALQRQWDQVIQDSVDRSLKDQATRVGHEEKDKSKKMELLLLAALKGGNFDTAILMLSAVESRQANEIAGGLMSKVHELQQQRQSLADEMGKLGSDGKSAGKLSELNTKAGDIGTEIGLLQTFLQDVMATKKEAQELASQTIRSSHETAQSIIQNIGR